MRAYSAPPTTQVPTTGNLTDDVVANAREAGSSISFSRRVDGQWQDVSAARFLTEVSAVAKGLIAAGIEPGDRVGIMSRTRYEWTLLDYAIWFAGAVTVPVYETSSAEQVAWILADSGARAVVVETPEHAARVAEVRGELPDLGHVWSLGDDAVAELMAAGADVSDAVLEQRRTTAGPHDLATIVYTSGTTGRPKGCMLTHGNFMVELDIAVAELERLFITGEACTLLFLPLAHVFARIIQIGCVRSRTRLGHSPDVRHLLADLQSFRPTFILAVPRVFEKVFTTAAQRAAADGRGRIFDRAADVAIAYSQGLERGGASWSVRVQHAVFARLVYRKLLDALGGRCQYAVSGGAPLGERLGHFYRGLGLVVLEGYGMTECTAALTANTPRAVRIGTVGRPLPGTEVRVADDGELLFRGHQVFPGYWRDEEATRDVLDADGWLHTGDVGEIDDAGFVRITGRKKEILVTAGGKNVAPAVLEDRVRMHPLVSQCLVVGDGRPYVAALVTIDPDAFRTWADAHGLSGPVAEHVSDPALRAEIASAVEAANRAVSQAESIRTFTILPQEWTEEGGQLTPSLKLKRGVLLRDLHDEIVELYS